MLWDGDSTVERRFLDADSLALIRAQDAPPPPPAPARPVRGVLSRTEAQRSGSRGRAVQQRACANATDWTVIETLRATGGNISAAADLLRFSPAAMWRRVSTMRNADRLPADVVTGRAVMYAARRPRGTVA
ncbi:MAG: helix-turn-helix domain-containing protein [Candidatus Moraniibacteriota bacterium]